MFRYFIVLILTLVCLQNLFFTDEPFSSQEEGTSFDVPHKNQASYPDESSDQKTPHHCYLGHCYFLLADAYVPIAPTLFFSFCKTPSFSYSDISLIQPSKPPEA
jgi:hypothetical protein